MKAELKATLSQSEYKYNFDKERENFPALSRSHDSDTILYYCHEISVRWKKLDSFTFNPNSQS